MPSYYPVTVSVSVSGFTIALANEKQMLSNWSRAMSKRLNLRRVNMRIYQQEMRDAKRRRKEEQEQYARELDFHLMELGDMEAKDRIVQRFVKEAMELSK